MCILPYFHGNLFSYPTALIVKRRINVFLHEVILD